MPCIEITKISDQTKVSKEGRKYQVTVVEGMKYGTTDQWTTNIFKNQKELLDQLNDFGPGEVANFKFVKNGNFYDLTSIEEPTQENLDYAKKNAGTSAPAGGPGGGGGNKSNTMSKEEWAEKDRKTKIGMSIHNSVAAASRLCKVGTKPEAVVEYAKKLLPYLMSEELPIDNPFVDKKDALEPPDVD